MSDLKQASPNLSLLLLLPLRPQAHRQLTEVIQQTLRNLTTDPSC